jgi:signal transduction histidine kinase
MSSEGRYQEDVLLALLRWTMIIGPLAAVLNMLGFIIDPSWTTPVGSAGVLMLALIAWRCRALTRRGQIERAARIYIISGMIIMALVVFIAARHEILLGAMGLSVFLVMATFFEPSRPTIRWGIASALLYEGAFIARELVPSLALGLRVEILTLYLVPPIILFYFAFIGRITTTYLLRALAESEAAAVEIAQSYAEVEQRVAERTRDLVKERYRLSTALRELTVARDQAEAASRAKSAFLANMSHELRTPLTAILGYTALIEREAQIGGHMGVVADLGQINTAGQHLLNLISDVLDLAKVEAGALSLQLAPCDVTAMIDEVVSAMRPLAAKNKNSLDVYYVHQLGMRYLDRAKVAQILGNLLSNATKFTERGAITLAVANEDVGGDAWLTFSVADTGIGIAAEQMRQLFHPFTQGAAAIEHVYGGTGLGLAICHRFALLMGGEITVISEPSQGTTFTVRLPAAIAQDPPAQPSEADTTSGEHVSTAHSIA